MNKLDESVYEFILKYTEINEMSIVKGRESVSLLPSNTEEYAIFTNIFRGRRGTNIEQYNILTEKTQLLMSTANNYQIDIVSSSVNAREYVSRLELVARSSEGVDFFKKYNVSLLYADDSQALHIISTTERYLYRYMLTLYLEELTVMKVNQDGFTTPKLNIKNINDISKV